MGNDILKFDERIRMGLELGESHFREFKSAIKRTSGKTPEPRNIKEICKDIGEVLVSFANADGGELLIGIEDNGTPSGIPHKEDLVNTMMKAYDEYVHPSTPLPVPSQRLVDYESARILYISIQKSTRFVHLTADGRCLQRFDRENRPVPAEKIQYGQKEQESREYDRGYVEGAKITDLNTGLISSLATHIRRGSSPEDLLRYLDLAEYSAGGLKLRRAAMLLFSKNITDWHPSCAVRIMRVEGTNMQVQPNYNVTRDETIRANIIEQLEQAWDLLRQYLVRPRARDPIALFRESIMYPEVACNEALINAIAHRDYSMEGRPIEILIYDDRMEVKNPGELLSSILLKDLRELKRPHQSRNVYIARVLRTLGYMQEIGEGIPRIFNHMRDFDLVPPELESDAGTFTVKLYHKSVFSPKDVEWLKGYSDFDLTRDEQRVVLLGRDNELLSTNDIIKTLKIVDTDDFRSFVAKFGLKGLIHRPVKVEKKGGTRNIKKFRVRPFSEVQQYINELFIGFRGIGPRSYLSAQDLSLIRKHLSEGNPYKNKLPKSLVTLGFINYENKCLPRAWQLWDKKYPEPEKPLAAPPPSSGVGPWKFGELVRKHENRYGFITGDDGKEYFLHSSALTEDCNWDELAIGTVILFKVSGSTIPGKALRVYKARITEDLEELLPEIYG